jgi:rRNA-processing protein FCF1
MLLAIGQFKADVFAAVKQKLGEKTAFFVPKSVLAELAGIAEKGRKYERLAGIAMQAIERNNAEEVETTAKNADDSLIELAGQGFYIASNDSSLRKKIKSLGGKNIYLRKKKLVEME